MHKQEKPKLIWRSSLVMFLLLFVFIQAMPFIPIQKVFADSELSATKPLKDIVKAQWVTATGINVSVTDSSALFVSDKLGKDTKINVKDYLTAGFVYVGDQFDAEYQGKIFQGYKSSPFLCSNAGTVHTRNGKGNFHYTSADDDTQRLVVSGAGASTGRLKIRVADPSKPSDCIRLDMDIQITQSSDTAGSGLVGKWLDSDNIQTTIFPGVYKKNPGNTKQFISQAENQGPCKDTLVISGDDNALGTPVIIYDQGNGKNSPINNKCGVDSTTSGYISNDDQAATAPPGSGVQDPDALNVKTCESTGSTILNWIFCGVIDAVDKAVSGVDGVVNNMLSLDTEAVANNEGLHTLWSYFRNIASLLLVVVALVMIIAQSMGSGS